MIQEEGLRLLALALDRYLHLDKTFSSRRNLDVDYSVFSKHVSDKIEEKGLGITIGKRALGNIITDLRRTTPANYDIISFSRSKRIAIAVAIYVLNLDRDSFSKIKNPLGRIFNEEYPSVAHELIARWEMYLYRGANINQGKEITGNVSKENKERNPLESTEMIALRDVLLREGYYLKQQLIDELDEVVIILKTKNSKVKVLLKNTFGKNKTMESSGFDGDYSILVFASDKHTVMDALRFYKEHMLDIEEAVIEVEHLSFAFQDFIE